MVLEQVQGPLQQIKAGYCKYMRKTKKIDKRMAIYIFIISMSLSFLPFLVKKAQAQYSIGSAVTNICAPCYPSGSASGDVGIVRSALESALRDSVKSIEGTLSDSINGVVEAFLSGLNELEQNFRLWSAMWWWYEFRPALQDITGQLYVAELDQARGWGSFLDAQQQVYEQNRYQVQDLTAHREHDPSERVCSVGTQTAGFWRGNAIARIMGDAREVEQNALLMNATGTDTQRGSEQIISTRWNQYTTIFCDTDSNGGEPGCAASGTRPNGDVSVSKTFLNALTMEVKNPAIQASWEMLFENIIGSPLNKNIHASTLTSERGQKLMLAKRSKIARQAVARSTLDLMASWRMPGSDNNDNVRWLDAIRNHAAGLPSNAAADAPAGALPADITTSNPRIRFSENPSYKEIMHVLSVDRIMGSDYGISLIDEPENIEREKAVLSSIYLMQLRDYYELLERISLILSVQVAMMIEEQDPGSAFGSVPTR